jgi:hypothetical protein
MDVPIFLHHRTKFRNQKFLNPRFVVAELELSVAATKQVRGSDPPDRTRQWLFFCEKGRLFRA